MSTPTVLDLAENDHFDHCKHITFDASVGDWTAFRLRFSWHDGYPFHVLLCSLGCKSGQPSIRSGDGGRCLTVTVRTLWVNK